MEERLKICEIYHVPHDHSFRWKWRYVTADGKVVESEREYVLYYECVAAARASGYQPGIKCL